MGQIDSFWKVREGSREKDPKYREDIGDCHVKKCMGFFYTSI